MLLSNLTIFSFLMHTSGLNVNDSLVHVALFCSNIFCNVCLKCNEFLFQLTSPTVGHTGIWIMLNIG